MVTLRDAAFVYTLVLCAAGFGVIVYISTHEALTRLRQKHTVGELDIFYELLSSLVAAVGAVLTLLLIIIAVAIVCVIGATGYFFFVVGSAIKIKIKTMLFGVKSQ